MNRKKVKSAMLVSALVVVSVLVLKSYMVYCSNGRTSDLMLEENVEALTSGESGAACPDGCKNIGWGLIRFWNVIVTMIIYHVVIHGDVK